MVTPNVVIVTKEEDAVRNHTINLDVDLLHFADLMKGNDSNLDNIEAYKKAKDMFKSCMNIHGKDNKQAYLNRLEKIGGFPALTKEWKPVKYEDMVVLMKHLGLHFRSILNFYVAGDPYKPKKLILYPYLSLHGGKIGMDSSVRWTYPSNGWIDVKSIYDAVLNMGARSNYLKNTDKATAYRTLAINVFKLLKDKDVTEDDIIKDVDAMIDFEKKLALGKYEQELYREGNTTNNAMRLRELKKIAPQIDWVTHLNALFNLNMNENSTVIVINPKYMTLIGNLTINTDKRAIANSLLWAVTFDNLEMLGPRFTELELRYHNVTKGIPQDEYCIGQTGGPLAYALSGMFVTKFLDKDSKSKVQKIADDFSKFYENLVLMQKWMDNNTRKAAVEKMSAMKAYVGYPDELTDVNKINNITSNINITDNYFMNKESVNKASVDEEIWKLKHHAIHTWLDRANAKVVNGFYNAHENTFGCAMNLGAVGFFIGHEISHGFDDRGSTYAADGTFKNWWSNSTRLEYNNKIQCFKTEYAKYDYPHVENKKLNTNISIGEIVGDFTGLESSYHFLEEYLKANGGDKKHDSFGYTDRQLFWIAYGQLWCNKIKVEEAKRQWEIYAHPPGEIRLNGPLKHSQQFSKDFGCKTDDEMNPKLKCSLWE
ncbi:Endothelin-converting enzyme 1 [Nymphon striatum]|nr:Endothelin-converting enzyme 1 [Nymphon striatum]